MSMITRVIGVRDLDGKFDKMMNVKLACETAGVGYPDDVKDYFGYPGELPNTLRHQMEAIDLGEALCYSSDDGSEIYEVDLSKLPEDVKTIRFINRW